MWIPVCCPPQQRIKKIRSKDDVFEANVTQQTEFTASLVLNDPLLFSHALQISKAIQIPAVS
jgi:hypothetical protein